MAIFGKGKELKAAGMTMMVGGFHIHGLPLGESAQCMIRSFPEKLQIVSGNTSIDLARHKIVDIHVITERDVQKLKSQVLVVL